MIGKWMIFVPLFAISSWAAVTQQDAKTVIGSATTALGADNLKTVEFSGSGFDYVIGQAPNPTSPWPKFNDKTYTRVVDLDAPASRMQRIRMQGENPPRGGGQQPIVGEQPQTQTIIVSANTPWVQQLEIFMIKMRGCAYTRQNRLDGPCGAMNIEPDLNEAFDHSLDVFLGRSLLHCNYHGYFPVSPFWDASSSFCSARITSMMRS